MGMTVRDVEKREAILWQDGVESWRWGLLLFHPQVDAVFLPQGVSACLVPRSHGASHWLTEADLFIYFRSAEVRERSSWAQQGVPIIC